MVSETSDILSRTEAKPSTDVDEFSDIVFEILDHGSEAIIELETGRTIELHGHDTHVYPMRNVIFTENEHGEEEWLDATRIISVRRH